MINKIYVHNGCFHADDVMCVALMKKVNPDIEVIRTNRPPKIYGDDTIVADIGFGKYDHHQPNAELRPDGKKYAACGLIFRDFWKEIFPDEASANAFNKKYILPIEDQDNGVTSNPLSAAIFSFNPPWNESGNPDIVMDCFMDAVSFLKRILDNEIKSVEAKIRGGEQYVIPARDEAIRKGLKYMVLEQYAPFDAFIRDTDILYAVYPSNRNPGDWTVYCARGDGFNSSKKTLPEYWKNKHCSPVGMNFLHTALFTATFNSKETAIKAAQLAINA